MFQSPTKEAFSRSTLSTLGDQIVDHVSILIDGPPKIEALTLNRDEEFIDVPDIAESSLFPTQSSRVGRSELLDTSIGSLHRRQGFLAPRASLLRLESSG